MKTIECKYCGKEIPFDSLLCSYCGRQFNEVQGFIKAQKEKRRKIIELNKVKTKLMKDAFRPVKLQISKIRPFENSYERENEGFKSKLIIYFLGFSIFLTFIIVIIVTFGLI